MTVVSLVVLYSMAGILAFSRFSLIEAYWTDAWMAGLMIFPHIIMISMDIGIWVILLICPFTMRSNIDLGVGHG